jgi:2-methylcitrate dehydratase PrpD
MNLAYAVAVTLLDGTALAAQFSEERIDADDVWELIEKTTVRHDPAYDGYHARVEVDDRVAFVEHPRGGLLKPLANGEVVDKFRTLVVPLLEPARAAAIEQAVLHLEELADTSELIDLLAAPV